MGVSKNRSGPPKSSILHRAQNGWHNSHCKIATGTVPCTTVRSVVEPSTRHFPCQIYLAIMQNLKKKKKKKMQNEAE